MFLARIALVLLAALGHLILWVALVNRLHAHGLPRPLVRKLTRGCFLVVLVLPLVLAWSYPGLATWVHTGQENFFRGDGWPLLLYFGPCWLAAIYGLAERVDAALHRRDRSHLLISNRTQRVDVAKHLDSRPVGDRLTSLLARLPGNEILHLALHETQLQVPRLPPSLDGLKIVHLSDLHMSGNLTRPYFEEVARRCNQLEADLVAITGDLFDAETCVDWIPATLGRIRARQGVYFVMGNHDLRIDTARARTRLREAGLVDLGGRWHEVVVRGQQIVLAGNELPWFPPAADLGQAPPTTGPGTGFRLLLSHTPDQFDWARRADFDLMLAGHTHGGQIRLPLIGPIVAPSRLGTRLASGTFYSEPTLLHVSRGVSSHTPLRLNCPPEISALILRSGSVVAEQLAGAAVATATT